MDSTIQEGHYAKKQLRNPLGLIRWSHRARFAKALKLAADLKGRRVLDFGCGDATFLALLADSPNAPAAGVGAEIESGVVVCQLRDFQRGDSVLGVRVVFEIRPPTCQLHTAARQPFRLEFPGRTGILQRVVQ